MSHCDAYTHPRTLSEILATADRAFMATHRSGSGTSRLGAAQFVVSKTFIGEATDSVELVRGSPSHEDDFLKYVQSRYQMHVTPEFFWTFAANPSPYGFLGESPEACELVPVSVPSQTFIIVIQDRRITMFEPVRDQDDPLEQWLQYFSQEIRPSIER